MKHLPSKSLILLPLLGTFIIGALLLAQTRMGQCHSFSCYLQLAVLIGLADASCLALYHIVLYPSFLSPLRNLPKPKQRPLWNRLLKEPSYRSLVKWINDIPNDGLIRYYGFLNAERVLVTTPEGCKDVLQTQAYNYIKLPWALKVMALTAFGGSIRAVDEPDSFHVKHFRNLFSSKPSHITYRVSTFLLPYWTYLRLPVRARHEILEAQPVIGDFIRPLIKERREDVKQACEKEYKQGDIIATLLQTGTDFTDDYLIDQSINFMIAGQETTATAASLTLFSLSENPEIQVRLREEIRSTLPSPSSGVPIDAVLVESLPSLAAVCNEVLRLYSPVVYCHRQTVAPDTKIGNVPMPIDTVVTVAPGLIHESRSIWGLRANEFDPERWLVRTDDEIKIDKLGGTNDPYAVMPFTYGPRQCIGEKFARGELLVLVAQLVSRFEWKFKGIGKNGDKPMKMVYGIVAGPLGGGMTMHTKRIEGW